MAGTPTSQALCVFGPRKVILGTGEVTHVLVDRATDVALVLPRRWVVRTRRETASANSIEADLYGIGLLYEWGVARQDQFERRLEEAGQLTPPELDSLIAYIRAKPGEPDTHGRRLRSIEQFLVWAADPPNRGGVIFVPPEELQKYGQRVHATLKPYLTGGDSNRPEPLTKHEDDVLRALIGPVRGPRGEIAMPVRFSRDNPFRQANRVRNWLIYLLERQKGLRVGEMLALKLEDCPIARRAYFSVRRRPDDPDDPRREKPEVKGAEGLVDSDRVLDLALKLYLTEPRHPGRRARGRWPYLLTAAGTGRPLTFQAVDAMWQAASNARPLLFLDDEDHKLLSNHKMRHTWAEELARDLILERKMPQELAVDALRQAGRWRKGSTTPFHYIQNAITELRRRVDRDRVDTMYPDDGEYDE